jgi:hypothetical protein
MNGDQELIRALNTYYSLKSEYEDNIDKLKKRIMENKTLSWKEKHKEFQKLKSKCINCNRPVGTIFDIRFQKDVESRIAKAMCGDRTNPCALNIELNLGMIMNIEDELHDSETKIREIRREIIKDKNDLLFGYVSAPDAIAKFDKIKEKMADANASYEIILNTYMSIVDNKPVKEKINKLLLDTYADIQSSHELVNKYEREQNVDFINDLVTMYITRLTPKLVQLRQLLYPYTAVEKYDKECVLIQRKMEIEQMELDMATNPQGVIHFDVGEKAQLRPGAGAAQNKSSRVGIEQSSSREIEFDDNDENTDE